MKAQNLNELRYVMQLSHESLKDPFYYYVGEWPDPELAAVVNDETTSMHVFDSVYYSTKITDAKTFDAFLDAQKTANHLLEYTSNWNSNLVAVHAKIFFKARLMGA